MGSPIVSVSIKQTQHNRLFKMVKICVQSPEVAMPGEINIHAQVSVVTKAKLDSVAVQGACQCDDVKKITDYVILIDGSDSYNNKVVMDGKVAEGEAFEQTKNWTQVLSRTWPTLVTPN